MLGTFQRGRIILTSNAVHTLVDVIHKILQRLQIVSIIDRVFIIFCTIVVEGVSVVTILEGGLYMRKRRGGEGPERVAGTQDILEPETDGATVSSLGSRFERFVELKRRRYRFCPVFSPSLVPDQRNPPEVSP